MVGDTMRLMKGSAMANSPLKPEQQELLDLLAACFTAAPSLRLGQILRYSLDQPNVQRPIAALPIIQDEDVIRGLRALHRQLTANKSSNEEVAPE